MPLSLPQRPNLEHLKNQARALLTAYRAGDVATRQQFETLLAPTLAKRPHRSFVLADAQFVLARQYGFANWAQLKQHVATVNTAPPPSAKTLAAQARAARLLAAQQRTKTLAEVVIAAAQAGDIRTMLQAFILPARDVDAVRAFLVEHNTFTLVVDTLLANVAHSNDRVRYLVAQAMDHFADARCDAPLRGLMQDSVPRVRWAAIHSYTCEDCKLEPLPSAADAVSLVIDRALHDSSIKVRRVAAYSLGTYCNDTRVRPVLETVLTTATDSPLRRNAQSALKRLQRRQQASPDEPQPRL